MGFTKLDEEIFDSSLTTAGPVPFAVFVLLLAKARPPDGVARVAPSVMAGRLLISKEECLRAFGVLQAADPESRSPESDGRRIERVDGGWRIINYLKYREKRDPDARREQNREAARRARERQPESANVSQSQPTSAENQPKQKQKQKQKQKNEDDGSRSVSVVESSISQGSRNVPSAVALTKPGAIVPELVSQNWVAEAGDIWRARFGGTAKYGMIGKELKELVEDHGWAFVRASWIKYLQQVDDSRYASAHHFATSLFGKLSGLRRDPPPKDDVTAHNSGLVDDATWNREMEKLGEKIGKRMGEMPPKLRG